jgi:PAS domain S-box-containing protein
MKLDAGKAFAPFVIAAFVLLISGFAAFDSLAAQKNTKRVFVLNSYHQGIPFSDNEMRGINDVFSNSGVNIETYITYMDMKRVPPSPQYFQYLKGMIREGYKGTRFDAVIATDNDALEFLRENRDELFPGVPLVFCGINGFNERMLDGRRDITGTIERTDYAGTIRAGLKLRPATKNIVVVVDNSTTGKAHLSEMMKIRGEFPESLNFTYLSLADMTMDELAKKLSELNRNDIVLLLHHFMDKNGISHPVSESTSLLAKRSSAPVFITSDNRLGFGVLGGYLISGYSQGESAARMVIRILNGTDVSTIPVSLKSPNQYMFDYNVMRRFGIAEGDLPEGSMIINKPVSALDIYRNELLLILCAFIILSGLVLYLLYEIRRRRKIEQNLRDSEEKYRILFENAGDAIFIHDAEGRMLAVNRLACERLGYSEAELMRMSPLDVDVTEEIHKIPERIAVVKTRGNLTFETAHRRKDGSHVPIEVSAKLTVWGGSPAVLSICRDISDRKRAEEELRKSEERFRNLITTSQEWIWAMDIEGRHTFSNPAVENILGYRSDEIVGRSWRHLIHETDLPKVGEMISRCIEQKTGWSNLVLRWKHKDGTYRFLESNAVPILDGSGNLQGFQGSDRDITERKQAEAELLEREARIRSISNNLTSGFIYQLVVNSDGTRKFTYLGDSIKQLYGIAPEDAVADAMLLYNSVHKDDIGGLMRAESDAARTLSTFRGEVRIKTPSGEQKCFYLSSTPTLMDDGSIRWDGISIDITERKTTEEALRRSEARLNEAQRIAKIGSWEIDHLTGRLIWSDEMFRIFEMDPGQTDTSIEIFRSTVHPDDICAVDAAFEQSLKNHTPFRITNRHVMPDGRIKYTTAYGETFYSPEGKPVRSVGTAQDITELKLAEEERDRLQERLQRAEKMEALGILAGGVAHDLNNVLGIVIGYSELLLFKTDESSPLRTDIGNIMRGGERAAAIVQDLLTLARRGVRSSEVINLNTLIMNFQKTPEYKKVVLNNPRVRIETELEPDLLNIAGSPVHLGKTFMNLVINAMEAMSNSGLLKITTANQYLDRAIQGYDNVRQGDYVVLIVADTGEGIEAKDIKRIFEPFYTKKVMGRSGTGLGLAVVWGTVKDHKGYIDVRSEKGRGTLFTLYFPVTREELSAARQSSISISEYMGGGGKHTCCG